LLAAKNSKKKEKLSMGADKKQIPVADQLFTWPPSDDPRMIATKCKSCGSCFFPRVPTCSNPDCKEKQTEDIQLSRRGRLQGYTVHFYEPPPPYYRSDPDNFTPYGIALVEFPEGVAVVGQTTGCDPLKDLKAGMEMETMLERIYDDEEGNEVIGWRFRPVL